MAQRDWAQLNPIAGMHGKPLNDEAYYASEMVAAPFRMLDATPTSDGGRALVLTTVVRAKALGHPYVVIRGFGSANQPVSLSPAGGGCGSAAYLASRQAFDMAGVTPADIDACEFYDCFTYTVEATLRDYGFFKRSRSATLSPASVSPRRQPSGQYLRRHALRGLLHGPYASGRERHAADRPLRRSAARASWPERRSPP